MKKGFSLVELLVVIAIIATLSAILMPNFMGAREKALDSQHIQDLGTIKNALRMYYNDHQAYPTPFGDTSAVNMAAGNTLGAGFGSYLPAATNLGYTYSYFPVDTMDGFVLCVGLNAHGNPEAIDSQLKCNVPGLLLNACGASAGTTSPDMYAVCAN